MHADTRKVVDSVPLDTIDRNDVLLYKTPLHSVIKRIMIVGKKYTMMEVVSTKIV